MDNAAKLNLIMISVLLVLVVCVFYAQQEYIGLLKEMKVTLNSTDSFCCQVYRNPMMKYMCANVQVVKHNAIEPLNLSTSYQPFP
jgi:hypothetical protein